MKNSGIVSLFLLVLLLAGCQFQNTALDEKYSVLMGQVIDGETGEPLSGVDVDIDWYRDKSESGGNAMLIFSPSYWQNIGITETDQNGFYIIINKPKKKMTQGEYGYKVNKSNEIFRFLTPFSTERIIRQDLILTEETRADY